MDFLIPVGMANKNILLIEPGYKNKYPPLGLMKIAQYHGANGKKDNVKFIKGGLVRKVLFGIEFILQHCFLLNGIKFPNN